MFFFWTGLGEQMPARGRVLSLLLKILRVAKIQDLKEKKVKKSIEKIPIFCCPTSAGGKWRVSSSVVWVVASGG
jgi:hypothetical protein